MGLTYVLMGRIMGRVTVDTKHLELRSNGYRVVLAVPTALQAALGKRVLRTNLKTRDLLTALSMRDIELAKLRATIADAAKRDSYPNYDAAVALTDGIIEHLLKLPYSPAKEPRFDWMNTIDDAREMLSDKLTTTLRRDVEESLDRLYLEGQQRAARGLRRHGEPAAADALPRKCPYTLDDICREDWYPDRPGEKP